MAKKTQQEQGSVNTSLSTEVVSQKEKEKIGLVQKSNGNYEYIAKKRSVRAKTKRRTVTLVMVIFLLIAILVTASVYSILAFVDFNNFRITVNRNGSELVSLSDTVDFINPSSVLNVEGPKKMDNISYNMIDMQSILNSEGQQNKGYYYIASTFYLANLGSSDCEYKLNITMGSIYKGLDSAIRILVVRNSDFDAESKTYSESGNEYFCYAKERNPIYLSDTDTRTQEWVSGGDNVVKDIVVDPNAPVSMQREIDTARMMGTYSDEVYSDYLWKCINFQSESVVVDSEYSDIKIGEKIRFSIVIWLEGTDPQCTDDVLGGKVSMEIKFESRAKEN